MKIAPALCAQAKAPVGTLRQGFELGHAGFKHGSVASP